MPQLHPDLYALPPMRALLASESAVLAPELARSTGDHALHIAPDPEVAPPPLPLLGHWARLHLARGGWLGDVQARADEPLPFQDDAFGVVVLRHAVEIAPDGGELIAEAARVLEPGGVLAITGVHPVSAWAPWFQWRARGTRASLRQPVMLRAACGRAELHVIAVHRAGQMLPSAATGEGSSLAGGAYILLARKQRIAATPLRVTTAIPEPVQSGSLVSGARRAAR
jgi:SAM-dependent methyltransferase